METISAELMGDGQAGVPEVAGGKDLSTEVVGNAVAIELQSSMMLAKKYPRNLEHSRAQILATCRRPLFAEKVNYAKPIGKTKVGGIAIRAAEMLANLWGNIKIIGYVMFDDDGDDARKIPGRRIIHVMVIDLETNTSYSAQAVLKKTVERKRFRKGQVIYGTRTNSYGDPLYIVKPTEDEFVVKERKEASILIRNCILRIIPYDIKEEMVATAKETTANRTAKDPDAELRKILDYFSGIRILPKAIEDYLGHPIQSITNPEIDDLREVANSIKSGESTWYDHLELAKEKRRKKEGSDDSPKGPKDTKQTLADKIKEKASAAAETKKNATSAPRPAPSASPPASTEQESDYIEYSAFEQLVKESGDKETLLSCKEFIQKLDPSYFDEAHSLIKRTMEKLEGATSSTGEPKPLPMVKRLKVALRKLTPEQRATYAKIVFQNDRAKDIKVDDLDEKQVETLKNTMTSADHFEE